MNYQNNDYLIFKDGNQTIKIEFETKQPYLELNKNTILDIFRKLDFTTLDKGDTVLVTVPSRRIDIAIEEDLVEEVGRIYGIDNIEGRKMILPVRMGKVNKTNRSIRHLLSNLGLSETLTYSLIKESEVHKYTNDTFDSIRLQDPMTEERSTLRYSLIPSESVFIDDNIENIRTGNSLGIISKKVEPDNYETIVNVIKELNLI